jgi:hypothetical protein
MGIIAGRNACFAVELTCFVGSLFPQNALPSNFFFFP